MLTIWKPIGLCLLLGLTERGAAGTAKLLWNGSGCPKAEERRESSGGQLMLTREVASTFSIKKGPGVRLIESRKNCSLLLSSEGSNEQYALEKIEIHGKSPTAPIKQELIVDLSGQGQSATRSLRLEIPKASETSFTIVKTLGESDQVWSGCDRGVMLNTKHRIEGEVSEPSSVSLESINYQFKVKPCSK